MLTEIIQGFWYTIEVNVLMLAIVGAAFLMAALVVVPLALGAVAWESQYGRSYRRWGAVVGALLALAAVLFLPAFGDAQEKPDYQEMADDAVRTLKGSRVWVETTSTTFGQYDCNRRLITLGTAGNAKWLLAHELGHHILGHCDEAFQQEVDANQLAVRILQVWGMTEEAAYRMTANHLLGLQNFRKNNPRPGHNYCAELQALMGRYVDRYPPKDPAKVRETCPLALPAGALEPTVRLAQWTPQTWCPVTYTEYHHIGGRTVVCIVFVDCFGNVTRTCS